MALAFEHLRYPQHRKALREPNSFLCSLAEHLPFSGYDFPQDGSLATYLEGPHASAHRFLMNYSKLEAIQMETLLTVSRTSVAEFGGRYGGRVVLIGNASESASDRFTVPGRSATVPGVYLHATAVYTLAREPLLEPTHQVRLVVDLALTALIIILVGVTRRRLTKAGHGAEGEVVPWVYFGWTSLGLIPAGVALVYFTHVMWLDFVLVAAALLLHAPLEHLAQKRLERWLPKSAS
jgi:CHASE2 domain-containing sensor protein